MHECQEPRGHDSSLRHPPQVCVLVVAAGTYERGMPAAGGILAWPEIDIELRTGCCSPRPEISIPIHLLRALLLLVSRRFAVLGRPRFRGQTASHFPHAHHHQSDGSHQQGQDPHQ